MRTLSKKQPHHPTGFGTDPEHFFLLNNGAKVITHYSCEEETTGMVAEE